MPGGHKIRKAKLRGVASEGMICSESELELGDESDGIMVLEDGVADPGTPAGSVIPLGEAVLELEVTPNRTDCFGDLRRRPRGPRDHRRAAGRRSVGGRAGHRKR